MIVVPMIVIVIRQVGGSWLALVNNPETLSTGKSKDL